MKLVYLIVNMKQQPHFGLGPQLSKTTLDARMATGNSIAYGNKISMVHRPVDEPKTG